MNRFDEKIKQMAKRESFILPKGFEKRTDVLLEQLSAQKIETDSQPKKPRLLIAAAILILAFALVAAAYGTGIISHILYNFSGKPVHTEYEESEPPASKGSAYKAERSPVDSKFIAERVEGEIRRICRLAEDGKLVPRMVGELHQETGLEELKDLLKESKDPWLMFPKVFPEGYDLTAAAVTFYLSQEYVSWDKLPDEFWEGEDGQIMQVFRMPEEYRRYVRGYSLEYNREGGWYLGVSCRMAREQSEGMNFILSETGTVEPLSLEGFEKALRTRDVNPDGGGAGIETQDAHLYLLQKIESIPYYHESALDRSNTEKRGGEEAFHYVIYTISASGREALGDDELIEIAKSLALER